MSRQLYIKNLPLLLISLTITAFFVSNAACCAVQNEKPIAYIELVSPSVAPEGTDVVFSGYGIDVDGHITGWEWISSIDGKLASIEQFSNSSLSVGIHQISFRVKDNRSLWSNTDTLQLVIGATESMDSAIDILLDMILPNISEATSGEPYVCLRLDTSLPGNTTIVEDVVSGLTITLHEEIFFFLLDIAPGEPYPHSLKYILVNLEGKYEVFDASGLPKIDGLLPGIFTQRPLPEGYIVASDN